MPTTRTAFRRPSIGLAVCVLGTPDAAVIARRCGYDFLVVDMEHGRITVDQMAGICVAGLMGRFPVYVRVTGPSSPDIARVLDCGAAGLIVPHVDSVEDARAVVRAVRFPPTGERALPGAVALFGFAPVDAATMVARSEATTQVVAMIESRSGLEAAGDIAATPGIDMLMIGANDLACALGHMGDLDRAAVRDAFGHVAQAAHAAGKGFATMGLPEPLIRGHALSHGAQMIVATNEINVLMDAGIAVLERLRALVQARPAA